MIRDIYLAIWYDTQDKRYDLALVSFGVVIIPYPIHIAHTTIHAQYGQNTIRWVTDSKRVVLVWLVRPNSFIN